MKQKKNLMILLLISIIGVVGITIAYFSSQATFENFFETSEYGTEYIEKFTSPDNWLPGDVTEKTLEVRNSGTVDEAARVKVEESWVSKNGTTLPLKQGNNVAADIHWINGDDWTKVTVDGEDYYYYYYNYKLAPEETTSKLLDKVTFNPLINATTSCSDTVVDGVLTRTCNSDGKGYDGATYTLKFTIETVQYNKYKEAWDTGISIAPSKEIVVFGLHVNQKSETYITGDKHQMFAFKHAATAQTPVLTDYRYIGNDPYNYVYFNCDDLNNQNIETCEVWRILGVFDVEKEIDDPDPEHAGQKITVTEQRMKLVRGYLHNDQLWDVYTNSYGHNDGRNDWTIATLKTFLNGDYYNGIATDGLKASAREMIDEAKYYLGSISPDYNDTARYGSTEKIYGEERGTIVCGACGTDESKLTWQGNIGLMYPSDEYMVYGNEVNTLCYSNPYGCSRDNAKTGWVYMDNKSFETWLLSPYAGMRISGFVVTRDGKFEGTPVYVLSKMVRPVVYLSADVQIIDGDGSEGNPYKLKK